MLRRKYPSGTGIDVWQEQADYHGPSCSNSGNAKNNALVLGKNDQQIKQADFIALGIRGIVRCDFVGDSGVGVIRHGGSS